MTDCATCGLSFKQDYKHLRYCQDCRRAFGVYMQRESSKGPPPKGRDRITERLRDGFAAINASGDMPKETRDE
ncbi:hypothetical protein LCGC14_2726000 [marine sediment metagenome]|uniref:Uncharacterized protein n=1 Tax=marine sediment metagenome TaxID=412755 RepID=A0A0F8ZW60_9ZZZZ